MTDDIIADAPRQVRDWSDALMVTDFLHPGARERQTRPTPSPAPPRKAAERDFSEVSPPQSAVVVEDNHRRVVLYQHDGTPLVRKVGF